MSDGQYYPPGQQPGQQPGQPGPPPGHYPMAPVAPPSSGKATTSLVLGIASLVACGLLLGIPAMIVAGQAKKEIRASGGRLGGEGLATAGFVTGLLGTIWSVLAALLVVAVFTFGSAFQSEFEQNCTTTGDDSGFSVECD